MATVKQTSIPGFAKAIMAVAFIFMPIFLILPFFFWGHNDTKITNNRINLIEARILPVGKLTIGSANAVAAQDSTKTEESFEPKNVYTSVCSACHGSSGLGAPVFANHDDWQKRLDEAGSLDALVKTATQGIGAMPAKGGTSLSDAQFREMVIYMLDSAKVSH